MGLERAHRSSAALLLILLVKTFTNAGESVSSGEIGALACFAVAVEFNVLLRIRAIGSPANREPMTIKCKPGIKSGGPVILRVESVAAQVAINSKNSRRRAHRTDAPARI